MKKYYYNCPRGFANEFDIISVDLDNSKECKAFDDYNAAYWRSSSTNWDLHEITLERADEIIKEERATLRSYKAAGLYNEIVGATKIITATDYFNL